MTQGPFKADGIHLEPGAAGTALTITRTVGGEMRFQDGRVTGGVLLGDLAGLRTVTGVLLVGRGGAGAPYTTIQAALDAVPVSSSLSAPTVILILPGVYTENLTVNRAGLTVVAMGRAVITPALAGSATITVAAGVSSTPSSVNFVGLTVLQPNAARAAVSLTGGAGSTVAADWVRFEGCEFVASGEGSYTVHADTVNRVALSGCRIGASVGTASMYVTQCAQIQVVGGELPDIQWDFNNASPRPSITSSVYSVQGCSYVGDVLSTLTGGGSLSLLWCPEVGAIKLNGNRAITLNGVVAGAVVVNGTAAVRATATRVSSLAGAGTWAADRLRGTCSFDAAATASVTFPVARPDADYNVTLDTGLNALAWVTDKEAGGFTINFAGPVTADVSWVAQE